MGNGAKVFGHFLSGHADAGIGNGQGILLWVGRDGDCQLGIGVQDISVGERLEINAGERI